MATKPKITASQPMCVVSIGYGDYLMPMTAATKVAELMAKAVEVDEKFAVRASTYFTKGSARVELKVVRPEQVRTGDAPVDDGDTIDNGSPRSRSLGQQALALPMPKGR